MTFGALTYGGIGYSVEAYIAEIACHALGSLDTSSTVVCLRAIIANVRISASGIFIRIFVHACGAERLTLNTQVAFRVCYASNRCGLDRHVTVVANGASGANCETSCVRMEAITAVHLVN